MPWIGAYITRGIIDGGAMQMVKCMTQIVKLKGGILPKKVIDGRLEPYTGGPAWKTA